MSNFFRKHTQLVLIYGFLLLFIVVVSFLDENFLTGRNFKNLLLTGFPLLMVAFGQTLIILTKGIDLSLGGIVALCNVSCVVLMNPDSPVGFVAPVVATIVIGAACGALNGFVITRWRLAPIIVTLATSSMFSGLALFVLPTPGGKVHKAFAQFLGGDLGPIPVGLVLIVLCLVLIRLLTNETPFGKAARAIGGNEGAAYSTGIQVNKVKLLTYMLAGIFCAMAGIFLSAQMYSGDPTIGGSFATNSISATVVGGTMMSGAVGDPLGTVAGVFIIIIINNMLNLIGVSSFYQFVFQGVILILALAISALKDIKGGALV